MLKEIVLKEEIKIKDGKVYAYTERLNDYRQLDGCEVRKLLNAEIVDLTATKAELEAQLERVTEELTAKQNLDNTIAGLGYCKIETPAYKRLISGIVAKDENGNSIIEKYTHAQNCVNKGGK